MENFWQVLVWQVVIEMFYFIKLNFILENIKTFWFLSDLLTYNHKH